MTTATATVPATFELDESLKARILELVGRRKTGPLEIVREALAHLEREEDEDEAFYQEALEAERDYQEGDGYYNVFVNVETGEIEEFEYNNGLAGLG